MSAPVRAALLRLTMIDFTHRIETQVIHCRCHTDPRHRLNVTSPRANFPVNPTYVGGKFCEEQA